MSGCLAFGHGRTWEAAGSSFDMVAVSVASALTLTEPEIAAALRRAVGGREDVDASGWSPVQRTHFLAAAVQIEASWRAAGPEQWAKPEAYLDFLASLVDLIAIVRGLSAGG